MSKKNIVLIGYYGANFGDLLMLQVLLNNFIVRNIDVEILTYADVALLKVFLRENNFDNVRCRQIQLVSFFDFYKIIKRSNSIVWGGGTCFMDEGGTGGIKYMFAAKLLGARVSYIGIGVDSFRRFRTKACIFAMGVIASTIIARDKTSFEVIGRHLWRQSHKLSLAPDIAFGAPKHEMSDIAPSSGAPYIALCARDLTEYENLSGVDRSKELLNLAMRISKDLSLRTVCIIVGDLEKDLSISKHLEKQLLLNDFDCLLIDGSHLNLAINVLAHAQFVLTVRLHPAVVAHIEGVPYALYNYSDKNEKFAASVGSLGRIIYPRDMVNFKADFSKPDFHASEQLNRSVTDAIALIS